MVAAHWAVLDNKRPTMGLDKLVASWPMAQ